MWITQQMLICLKTPTYLWGLAGGNDFDLNTMDKDDIPYHVQDLSESAIHHYITEGAGGQGIWRNRDFNYYKNRPMTNMDYLSRWWDEDVMNSAASSAGLFTEIPLGIADWALGLDESFGRTWETPNSENLLRTGTDILSFIPPVRAYSAITRPFTLANKLNKGTKWDR